MPGGWCGSRDTTVWTSVGAALDCHRRISGGMLRDLLTLTIERQVWSGPSSLLDIFR